MIVKSSKFIARVERSVSKRSILCNRDDKQENQFGIGICLQKIGIDVRKLEFQQFLLEFFRFA